VYVAFTWDGNFIIISYFAQQKVGTENLTNT